MNEHLTSEQITRCLTGERGSAEQQHLDDCAACREKLHRGIEAVSLFRQWYVAQEPAVPAVFSRPAAPEMSSLWHWSNVAIGGLLVTCMLAGAFLIQRPQPQKHTAVIDDPSFIEIPYVAPLAPYERTSIVRMDVPVAALVAAGFEVHLIDAGASVRADVLFGQDGRAHAIRIVPASEPNLERILNR